MNRTQFLAVLAVIGVLGALIATRVSNSSEGAETAAPAAAAESETAETADSADAEAEPDDTDTSEAEPVEPIDAPPFLDDKPPLTDIDGWINTDATSLDDFDGQIRVIEFWTFGCFNCKNRIPHTQELYAEYQDQGLEIIGIHAPEFAFERDPEAVRQATVDLGVTWPVALDTEKTNFRAWQTNRRFWPRVFVLDQNGDVRYDRIGEGDYDGLEETVAYLIENGP